VAAPTPAGAPLPRTPQEAQALFTQLLSRLGGPDGASQLDAVSAVWQPIPLPACTAALDTLNARQGAATADSMCAVCQEHASLAGSEASDSTAAAFATAPMRQHLTFSRP
jgi:alpha-D-ribose 1-methylphosphonate 5-triphosphate synthase subunit PhnH